MDHGLPQSELKLKIELCQPIQTFPKERHLCLGT